MYWQHIIISLLDIATLMRASKDGLGKVLRRFRQYLGQGQWLASLGCMLLLHLETLGFGYVARDLS